jgi:hypothetical protein
MNRYYTINLTPTSTSPGPYTIYWNTVSSGSIATIFSTGLPATGLTLTQLTGATGVNVIVPDSTTQIIISNPKCPPKYIEALPTEELYDFCMNIVIPDVSTDNIHFNPNGLDSNGKHKWISDDETYQIVWNNSLNTWELQTWPCFGNICPIIKQVTTPGTYPPLTNWDIFGLDGEVTVYSGVCTPGGPSTEFRRINTPYSVNQPNCGCDGNIIINTQNLNGTPPYTYSINNGSTYSTSPFFNNLCTGIYNITVLDSDSVVYGNTVTLNAPTPPTTYNISLNTTVNTTTSTTYILTKEYTTTISVTPSLPNGVSITFDLIHNNNFKSSPNDNTSTLITNTTITKNSSIISYNSTNNSTGTTVNTTPGCQDLTVYQTGLTETWMSLTMVNTDSLVINTTTSVTKSEYNLCTVGDSTDTYSLLNAIINGCDCCNIIIT